MSVCVAVRKRERNMACQASIPHGYIYNGMPVMGRFRPEALAAVKEFDISHGDVLIAAYPKTGSSWMQELLWLVSSEGDIETANHKLLDERVPFIELMIEEKPTLRDIAVSYPHPRLLKTHLPVSFFTRQLENFNFKLILLIRNPKDTLVSYYHFYRMCKTFGNYRGTWNQFFEELVMTKHLHCGDYFHWYMGWCHYKDCPNVKFVHYEDMKSDLKAVLQDIAKFLNKSLSDALLDKIIEHLSFPKMKENVMTNYCWFPVFDFSISPFMRKGEVGDWKNYFSSEQNEYIDKEYRDSLLKAGIQLCFEKKSLET